MNYEWKIRYCKYTNDNDKGVVEVCWTCIGSVDNFHAQTSGTSEFTPDPISADYIAYENLTEQTVLGWVKADSQASVEAILQEKYNEAMTPATHLVGIPWPLEDEQ